MRLNNNTHSTDRDKVDMVVAIEAVVGPLWVGLLGVANSRLDQVACAEYVVQWELEYYSERIVDREVLLLSIQLVDHEQMAVWVAQAVLLLSVHSQLVDH